MGLGMNLIHLLFLHSRPPKRRQLTFACLLPAFYLALDHSELQFSCYCLPASWRKSSTSLALLSGEPQLLKCLSKHGKISRIFLSISVSSWSVSCWSASLWCFYEVRLPPPDLWHASSASNLAPPHGGKIQPAPCLECLCEGQDEGWN